MVTLQTRWLRLSAVLLCLGLSLGAQTSFAAAAKGKGKKPVAGPKNAALANALNEKGAGIQQCAGENGLDKGAKKVDISVRVTINNKGEVVDTHINVTLDGGDKGKVQDCVEKLVRSAKFPTVSTPLATTERSWTVAQQ